jgi:hypothetical protein
MAKKRKKGCSTCSPNCFCGLNPAKFGLALGILCGLAMFIAGLAATYAGYGTEIVSLIGSVYIGYDINLVGSIVGGIWGFLDGLIGGFIFAWLYNKLL